MTKVSDHVLRTPDKCFKKLEGYPFKPNYVSIIDPQLGPLRQHFVDEGPADGPVVLCLHGEPSWSYLYRTMIPVLAGAEFRVIAPDLIGFGRSDKPARASDYSYARMVGWMLSFVRELDLRDVNLFCQDWGGLIGLRVVAAEPARFARIVVSNSGLPEGGPMAEEFMRWRKFARRSPVFPIGRIIEFATQRPVSSSARKAYDAPFPSRRYKAAARALPSLVPIEPDYPGASDNRDAWQVLETFDRPVLTLFGDGDPVTRGWDKLIQNRIPGARGWPHQTIAQVGHFSQEDAGPELAKAVIDFVQISPGPKSRTHRLKEVSR
jgi:haloalkane dehalogenase